MPTVTIGSVVGSGSVNDNDKLRIKITSDVPASTPTTSVGLAIMIGGNHTSAAYHGVANQNKRPYITDTAQLGGLYGALGNIPVASIAQFVDYDRGSGNYTFAGGWWYIIRQPLIAGDSILLDFTAMLDDSEVGIGAANFNVLKAKLHRIDGLRADRISAPDGQTPGDLAGYYTAKNAFEVIPGFPSNSFVTYGSGLTGTGSSSWNWHNFACVFALRSATGSSITWTHPLSRAEDTSLEWSSPSGTANPSHYGYFFNYFGDTIVPETLVYSPSTIEFGATVNYPGPGWAYPVDTSGIGTLGYYHEGAWHLVRDIIS